MNNLLNKNKCYQINTYITQIQVLHDLKNYELKKPNYMSMELVKYARHTSLKKKHVFSTRYHECAVGKRIMPYNKGWR